MRAIACGRSAGGGRLKLCSSAAVPVPAVAVVDTQGSQLLLCSGTHPPFPPDVTDHCHGQTQPLSSERINIP